MNKNKTTMSEQIYSDIYADIINLRLNIGQKLTLKSLSEKYNASYTPIREALSRLVECGLVKYYSNCGVSVIDFTEEDIRDIFRFVGELDALAILYCKNTPHQALLLLELENVIENSNQLLAGGKNKEWTEYSKKFHKTFYVHAHSRCLEEASQRFLPKLELLSCLYKDQQTNLEKINREHIGIYEQIQKNHFDKAADLMRVHLQYDMGFAIQSFREYKDAL